MFHAVGYTVVAIMTSTQTLIVDLFPTQGSSVTAAVSILINGMKAILDTLS